MRTDPCVRSLLVLTLVTAFWAHIDGAPKIISRLTRCRRRQNRLNILTPAARSHADPRATGAPKRQRTEGKHLPAPAPVCDPDAPELQCRRRQIGQLFGLPA